MEKRNLSVERTETVRSTPGFRPVRLRGWLLVFLTSVSQGCYVYPSVSTAPAPGRQVRFDLNDRGRLGLGSSIGPAAERIEGILQADPDSAYSVKVVSVVYTNGQANRWSGEPLMISKNFVRDVRQRELSRSRTYLTAATVIGAAVLFVATRGLLGSGTPETDPPNPPPGGNAFKGGACC